jgi:hypothetical protein
VALDDLDLDIDFPTLLVSAYWIEAHCIVPDGFRRGDPFDLVGWQAEALLNHYRVRPKARLGQLAPAFFYRRSQIVLPQKAGKAPDSAARICLEGVGPALFAGWAKGGEMYDCRDHGCGCEFQYEYQPGEAMGRPWPTPLIQITATSEDQTANIYTALRPMIDDGPLSVLIPKTGEDFIRLPNNGRIDPVTSNARSRLGQRVTFPLWDESGLYLVSNKMREVAETQRRGAAGMGGRGVETTNAWDPTQESVAQRTAAAAERQGDIYRYHPLAPKGLSYTNKADRRKIHKHVYKGCSWIDLDAIEGEAAELVAVDPGQGERFFGNRPVAGEGVAFDIDVVKSLKAPRQVPQHATIVIGADGARYYDALAIVACEVKTGYMWSLGIWERPKDADDEYEHPRHEVDGAVRDAFERYNVWRLYSDEQQIEHLMQGWANDYGAKRVLPWLTNRPKQIAWAVRNLEEAIASSKKALDKDEPLTLSHSGDETLMRHFANARKATLTILDDNERPMHTLSKESTHSTLCMDGAMAATLAWEARGDCIKVGGETMTDVDPEPESTSKVYGPGEAPPAEWFNSPSRDYGPMGSLS